MQHRKGGKGCQVLTNKKGPHTLAVRQNIQDFVNKDGTVTLVCSGYLVRVDFGFYYFQTQQYCKNYMFVATEPTKFGCAKTSSMLEFWSKLRATTR